MVTRSGAKRWNNIIQCAHEFRKLLVGKLAALYAQSNSDSVVLQSVNDIETLTNGISRKIWQKIMILDDDATAVTRPSELAAESGDIAAPKSPAAASTADQKPATQSETRERRPLSEPG